MRSAWASSVRRMPRLNLALATLAAGIALATPAFAYRPFDGTDGYVADVGEFELEMGPAHFLSTPEGRYIVAPATVLNLGVARGLELVVDFKDFVGLQSVAGQPRMRLLDTDIFLKGILRRGTLQGESGVSIALEAGPLPPEPGGTPRPGAAAKPITPPPGGTRSPRPTTSAAPSRGPPLGRGGSPILACPP